MLFRDTIQEYEFDCCSRKMAPRAVGGYIKMLGYLADYLEQNHKITELEEIKGIHIKKFLMEKEKLGRKPSYINEALTSLISELEVRLSIEGETPMSSLTDY